MVNPGALPQGTSLARICIAAADRRRTAAPAAATHCDGDRRANPSFDYYLSPRLNAAGALPHVVADLADPPGHDAARGLFDGALVLFCRYLSRAWIELLGTHADAIAGTGLFVDDDIDALAADRAVPLWYRARLLRRHLMHRRALSRRCDVLLVAGPVLAARHAVANPFVLPPCASTDDQPLARHEGAATKVAFHSTSVHAAEHRWLRPVMRAALVAEATLTFDVAAGAPLSWHWHGLERTRIAAPLPWPRYRADSRAQGADILLAPLLPTAANAARSWTKRIDAMRLGAALLVSEPEIYRVTEAERALGMAVPMDPAAWTAAIGELARDRGRRHRLRDLNRDFVMRESAAAGPLLAAQMLPP